VSKRRYRFGMDYFGTRPLWARRDPDATGVFRPMILVIRDTHCEWKVSDLWNLYMAPKQALMAVEATPEVTAAIEALNEQA
jgi:hypothetical protein